MKYNPAQFINQVRREVARVAWPSRKEVLVTSAIVSVMVTIMAIFFIIIDRIISWAVEIVLAI